MCGGVCVVACVVVCVWRYHVCMIVLRVGGVFIAYIDNSPYPFWKRISSS